MQRKELTYEEFCALTYQYMQGMRFSDGAIRLYRNETHGLQHEFYTPFSEKTQTWGKQDNSYYIDGDKREFKTSAEFYVAYMEKACGVTNG